jgi:hypothetical protein
MSLPIDILWNQCIYFLDVQKTPSVTTGKLTMMMSSLIENMFLLHRKRCFFLSQRLSPHRPPILPFL